jgi:hypothetical protein
MKQGQLYYCLRTKCIFQCIAVIGSSYYLANPSTDSEDALLCVPEPKFRTAEAILYSNIIPNDEWEDSLEEALLWARTFRFYNRVFVGIAENMDYTTLDKAHELGFIRKCAILENVYESIAYLYNTESHKSFKEKNKLEYLVFMHQMKWLQENKKLISIIMELEPVCKVGFRESLRRK